MSDLELDRVTLDGKPVRKVSDTTDFPPKLLPEIIHHHDVGADSGNVRKEDRQLRVRRHRQPPCRASRMGATSLS